MSTARELDVDRLRHDVFLRMLEAAGKPLQDLSSETAALLGEHAARLVKAGMDGIQYFDRTGVVRSPKAGQQQAEPSRARK